MYILQKSELDTASLFAFPKNLFICDECLACLADILARLGTHSNPCDHYGCEGETREIVLRIAVISGCDASPVLELAEHSFDEISAFVGPAVQRIGRPA